MNVEINRKPLVSVVVPTYNREEFIAEAIDSVIQQTYTNWELIIIDDGSTDGTKTVVEGYLDKANIIYLIQENEGQSSARNKAIKISNGDYIAFLDSDNKWLANRLELGVQELLENNEISVVYGDIITIDEIGGEVSRCNMYRYSGRIIDRLLMDNFVSMNTTLTRKNSILEVGNVDKNIRRADDYDLWLRLSAKYNFKYISEYMAYYRVMDDQISSNKDGRFIANKNIIKDFHANNPSAVSLIEKCKGWSAFFSRKAAYESFMARPWSALYDISIATVYYPFWLRPWRVMAKLVLGQYKV